MLDPLIVTQATNSYLMVLLKQDCFDLYFSMLSDLCQVSLFSGLALSDYFQITEGNGFYSTLIGFVEAVWIPVLVVVS